MAKARRNLEVEFNENLNRICFETGYVYYQLNGQRSFEPYSYIMKPQRGCEIFVGRLPRNIYEDKLIPIFKEVGPIFKVRVMVDYQNNTRGYAFISYFNSECADKAVEKFNNYEIAPNAKIAVYKSVDNCRLLISHIDTQMTRPKVFEMLDELYVKGVKDVIFYANPTNPQLNRGYVFVEFESHRDAAIARRYLSSKNAEGPGKGLYVDWADPLPEVDPQIMATVKVLYLKPLPFDMSSHEVKHILSNFIDIQTVDKVHKIRDFAFVNFKERMWAELAYERLRGLRILDELVRVDWSKPPCYSKQNRQGQDPQNYCKNLMGLCNQTGYKIVQENGQRIYSPMVKVKTPPRGCEVFIGRIPKTVFEDILIPIFSKVGPLYKFRIMMEFNQKTRGYAFATYFNKEDANLAFVEGISDVIMYADVADEKLNRGFVFVEFESHRFAAMARRRLSPENLVAWGHTLHVDWADPLPEVDTGVMSKVRILFMKNLPPEFTNIELQAILVNYLGNETIKKTYKMDHYAFIHFTNRKNAEIGLQKLTGLKINQVQISIEWAIPRNFSKKKRLTNGPQNFCTNVPLCLRRLVHEKIKGISNKKRVPEPNKANILPIEGSESSSEMNSEVYLF
ncbi:unnamed protein product [Brassicogethes aeneus]|uniref:RRM domain-containing protein n=1 Tax=Brassicogethes aeneus TaxID=1431903 RepID=A0A9P0AQ23_BRAAE|nr:unnamed protein product [Brassicogethes aeneus]